MKRSPRSDVLVVDAEPVSRFGLVSLFTSHKALRIVGEAGTVRTARELCAKLKPHVIVLDPAMDADEGLIFLKEISRWTAKTRAVAFSGREEASYVQQAFSFGACGYIARLDPVPSLMSAVLGAVLGERHVGPRIERVLLDHLAMGVVDFRDRRVEALLSVRERQVFRLVGEGRVPREVADALGLSVKTVESHQHRIKAKLGLDSGAQLRLQAVALRDVLKARPGKRSAPKP